MGIGAVTIRHHPAGRYHLAALILCLHVLLPSEPGQAATPSSTLSQQRELYQQASSALARGERAKFRDLRRQLLDYPLLPYLDYADLSIRIEEAEPGEVDRFLDAYSETPLTPWLRQRWLIRLADEKRWQTFIHYYDSDLRSVDLACYNAFAHYTHGERAQGIRLGRELWREGRSRPESCDPVFGKLIADGHIDDVLAWERYIAAVLNHEYRLANYITRFFTRPETRRKAELYLQVDRNPRRIANYETFTDHSGEERQILYHGITHLARIDAPLALKLWNRYHQSHDFDADTEAAIIGTLVKALYQQGHRQSADSYLLQEQEKLPEDVIDWRLREMVQASDWQTIIAWSSRLAERHRTQSRWKYWQARALELSGATTPALSRQLYREISGERSFYGFLASEWLGEPYSMDHQPVAVSTAQMSALADTPAFRRIRELYHHDELTWARREWYGDLNQREPEQWLVAAKLAEQWGWHNQAIMSMIQARYWNDIDVRFPIPHQEAFITQADATAIPVHLLLALSRQESAFNERVTSPAGAKGLMQLMPATARETARKHDIRYSGPRELDDAEKNILIGSRYYKQMLERFDNNRILATAAYNAGPSRVERWRSRTEGNLPFDAWIEVIPFRETRNYVQNVLAFSIIYAHHLGLEVGILSPEEKDRLL